VRRERFQNTMGLEKSSGDWDLHVANQAVGGPWMQSPKTVYGYVSNCWANMSLLKAMRRSRVTAAK
jgi:hypothetical protein